MVAQSRVRGLLLNGRKDAENIFGQPERVILFALYDSVHVNPN